MTNCPVVSAHSAFSLGVTTAALEAHFSPRANTYFINYDFRAVVYGTGPRPLFAVKCYYAFVTICPRAAAKSNLNYYFAEPILLGTGRPRLANSREGCILRAELHGCPYVPNNRCQTRSRRPFIPGTKAHAIIQRRVSQSERIITQNLLHNTVITSRRTSNTHAMR